MDAWVTSTVKELGRYPWVTYLFVILFSMWGGLVSMLHSRQPFKFKRLVKELVTSAFAGMIVFYICTSSHVADMLTAAFVGIAGHMGNRGIFFIEDIIKRYILKLKLDKLEREL